MGSVLYVLTVSTRRNALRSGVDMVKKRELHAAGVRPADTGPNKWSVSSERDPATVYEVENLDGMWVCTCPDFAYRGGLCKHIILCQLSRSSGSDKPRPCDSCIEARHNGPAAYSAGCHVWCNHTKSLVEPEKKESCEWHIDRSRLIIV
jgi:hypothetical protein